MKPWQTEKDSLFSYNQKPMCLKALTLHLLHLQLLLILLLCSLSTSTSPKNIVLRVGGSNALQSATGYLRDNSILPWHADGLSVLCVGFLFCDFFIYEICYSILMFLCIPRLLRARSRSWDLKILRVFLSPPCRSGTKIVEEAGAVSAQRKILES